MAAIVYLDVDDEITSAAARIRGLEDERVALVLPLGSRLATSRINFRLLAREAEIRGKKIEIVTNDASARALAASAGLPTHLSVAAFEAGPKAVAGAAVAAALPAPGAEPTTSPTSTTSPVARPFVDDDSPTTAIPTVKPPAERSAPVPQVGRRQPTRRAPLIAAALILVGILVATATAAYLVLPSAEITLTPTSETIGPLDLNVTAQTGVTQPDLANLLVPAQRFTFPLEESDTFPATGVKVTETKASGAVTFANCDTSDGVRIPAGSIVSTSGGVGFRTLGDVMLQKARFFPPACDGGSVSIEAVNPGEGGNVGAGQIDQSPPGYDPALLLVSNEQPTSGGTHTETPQIAQADVDGALRTLDEALVAAFDAQIAGRTDVPEGTILFPETKLLGATTPSVDPATLVGTEATDFDLGLTAEGTVLGADPGPVATLAEARIRTAVDDGFRLDEETIVITDGTPIVAGTAITFPVTVRAVQTRVVDGPALLEQVRGLGLPQARTILGEYGQVEISVWPDWVTSIPTSEGRATLTVADPASPSGSPEGSGGPGSSP